MRRARPSGTPENTRVDPFAARSSTESRPDVLSRRRRIASAHSESTFVNRSECITLLDGRVRALRQLLLATALALRMPGIDAPSAFPNSLRPEPSSQAVSEFAPESVGEGTETQLHGCKELELHFMREGSVANRKERPGFGRVARAPLHLWSELRDITTRPKAITLQDARCQLQRIIQRAIPTHSGRRSCGDSQGDRWITAQRSQAADQNEESSHRQRGCGYPVRLASCRIARRRR